jgi:thiol-disulfide isomerase/thioredoxin
MWFVVILSTLITIYYIFFNNDYHSNRRKSSRVKKFQKSQNRLIHNKIIISRVFSDETSVPSRKKINKRHSKSKRIHVSPKIHNNSQLESIRSMNKLLKNRLNKTKLNVVDTVSNPTKLNVVDTVSNPTNISSKVSPKFIVRLFFADWCPHCVDFKPIWNKIKSKYGDSILFEDVDCTSDNPDLEYVQGLPTIALYDKSNNYMKNYENNGDPDKFNRFIQTLLA